MVTHTHAANPYAKLVRDMQAYLNKYVSFSDPQYSLVLALWTLATYFWTDTFDAFPYLVITSDTKRSGKTRTSELLAFMACNPRNFAGMTAATLFRSIRDEFPTVFIDEAETLGSESADTMRSVLNVGYRKGQTIPRMGKAGVEEWPAYCPKAFILIGDVFDTLKDRSIIVRMRRAEIGTIMTRFLYEIAKMEGNELGERAKAFMESMKPAVSDKYLSHAGLEFLPDRDAEIWLPLFSIAMVACPDRIEELTRAAVDMATMKTAEARRHSDLEMADAEREASDAEYADRLLGDVKTILGTNKSMFTADLLEALKALPTGPWRKFRGAGLDAMDLSNLLSRFGIQPTLIRVGNSRKPGSKVARGYKGKDLGGEGSKARTRRRK